jgi:Zn-dependent peptidase ImmA (M78 family)
MWVFLIFLNAADSKSAQMFTLCHELAHLWIGESGVSDPVAGAVPAQPIERWCNAIAAEVLVPVEELHGQRRPDLPLLEEDLNDNRKVSHVIVEN